MSIYCPYLDRDILVTSSSEEHIIPLSLGGHDDFTLPVDKLINSDLGRSIEGPLANDFFLARGRAQYDARGRSGKPPEFTAKRTIDVATKQPLQAHWGSRLRLWDPKARRAVPVQGQTVELTFQSKILDLSLQFLAKTFLSAGYWAYGDIFRNCVDHQSARLMMKAPRDRTPEESEKIRARVYVGLTPPEGDDRQREEFDFEEAVCQSIKGTVVVLAPGPKNCAIYMGVLGRYLGMINVSADTSKFPRTGDYDGGHVIVISNNRVRRCSHRHLMLQLLKACRSQSP